MSWVAGVAPAAAGPLDAQVRSRGAEGVASGQAVVLHDGDHCLGGAAVTRTAGWRLAVGGAGCSYSSAALIWSSTVVLMTLVPP